MCPSWSTVINYSGFSGPRFRTCVVCQRLLILKEFGAWRNQVFLVCRGHALLSGTGCSSHVTCCCGCWAAWGRAIACCRARQRLAVPGRVSVGLWTMLLLVPKECFSGVSCHVQSLCSGHSCHCGGCAAWVLLQSYAKALHKRC